MRIGNGLQLERDSSLPIQVHFDTLTQKATTGFVFIAILTFGFMFKIDGILKVLMIHLNPCNDTSCLALYEPASWSVVRWLSAVFLSILIVLPFGLRSMYNFAQPGLTKNEGKMLKNWMIRSSFLGYLTLFVLFYSLIPMLYSLGNGIHQNIGLTERYDAVALFKFVLAIFWSLLMTYVLAFATITAGSLGLITKNNQDWWRSRILGIGGVVLLLSLPGRWNGTNILMLSGMLVILEHSIRRSVRLSGQALSLEPMFDHEGRRRIILYVGNTSSGDELPHLNIPEHTALMRFKSLSTSMEERERLVDTIIHYRITDIVLFGCEESEFPPSFILAMKSAKCALWFLQRSDDESILSIQNTILNPNKTPNT
ncbi:MAG TPA: hypothetical protein HA320_02670 [Candidatus Poseidoniaceae archaeon]|nr:MAG TPA: hypothetical protein D7H78_02715 [Candidatus Poseidoniales archaeon]HII30940.1 hypothetical protein [Candidatus Poseidoniaceae archaeon]